MVFYGYVDNGEGFIKCKITAETAKGAYERLERFSAMVAARHLDFRGNIECLILRDENDNNICQSHIDDVQKCLAAFDNLLEVKHVLNNGFVVPEDIGFEFGGQWIQNPFYDETHRFEILNPYEYYGAENIEHFVDRLLDEAAKSEKKMSIDETLEKAIEQSLETGGNGRGLDDYAKD